MIRFGTYFKVFIYYMISHLIDKLKKQNYFLPYHFLIILFFSILIYHYAPYGDNEQDKKSFDNYFSTLYFTTMTHFTIGFGDIAPSGSFLRLISMIHVILAFSLFNI